MIFLPYMKNVAMAVQNTHRMKTFDVIGHWGDMPVLEGRTDL
jgi:hypothetical protein